MSMLCCDNEDVDDEGEDACVDGADDEDEDVESRMAVMADVTSKPNLLEAPCHYDRCHQYCYVSLRCGIPGRGASRGEHR